MNKSIKTLIITLLTSTTIAAENKIPQWFMDDLNNNIGTWLTDNTSYQNDKEKFDQYGMQWKWGVGKTSITGVLYGLIKGEKSQNFWEFRQYWDNQKQAGYLIQYGKSGVIGTGQLKPTDTDEIELIQTFSVSSGQTWQSKHLSKNNARQLNTTSYNLTKEKKWQKDRSYTWHKSANKPHKAINKLGTSSLSLAVKDIKASYAFYQKLGFKKIDGNIQQNWLILKNQNIKIGLFQGMFPQNTLTFNPPDARAIYQHLKNQGIKSTYSNGLDQPKGPASFSIIDPDGNPILIDQHQ